MNALTFWQIVSRATLINDFYLGQSCPDGPAVTARDC